MEEASQSLLKNAIALKPIKKKHFIIIEIGIHVLSDVRQNKIF